MKNKIIIISLGFVLAMSNSFSQVKSNRIEDVFEEMESDNLSIYLFNALNGKPLHNAKVTINEIGEFVSDVNGKIAFKSNIENGNIKL